MIDVNTFIISSDMTLVDAMEIIDKGARGQAFVCDNEMCVLGSVSDGDIRRYIMNGGALNSPIVNIMNTEYKYLTSDKIDEAANIMKKYDIRALPILDKNKKLLSIFFEDDTIARPVRPLNIPVVIMAGGKGTRLYPYTQVLPKPLIPIGEYTITEHIMQHFAAYGCTDYRMIVNYKRNMIKAYFSDTSTDWNIRFVDENVPLGTGGGIKLLEEQVCQTFFLTNCDILVEADYGAIFDYHKASGNIATMVCAVKSVTIPYGTVTINSDSQILSMCEKPTNSFLTNTGFYVLEPQIFDYIPDNTFTHITDIIQACMDDKRRVGVYPVSESQWSDMGQMPEMEKMYMKIISE